MKALATANAAMNLKQGADAIQAGQAKEGGNAADQVGGIGISASVGSSSSRSEQSSRADNARGSAVSAGGNISIQAKGAGEDSDLTIQGSTVKAGGQTTLKADDEVRLLAAANTTQEDSRQSSKSGSVGVTMQLGAGGAQMGVTASASRGTGRGAGNGTTYTNSQVEGQTVHIESGGDTTLKGAVVKGDRVTATVGGSLTVESLQDTSQYDEKSQQVGGSVTIGPASGASLSLGKTKINSDFTSVNEQSAIRAGDGGFAVNVAGNTTLTGGQITSTQAAIDNNQNSFQTGGTLTTTDLHNRASFEAQSVSVAVGTSGGKVAPGGVGFGSDKGSASSVTTAGISGVAGNTAARTGDKETGIGQIFNKEQAQQEVAAQVAITQEFGKQASKAVGDYAGCSVGSRHSLSVRAAATLADDQHQPRYGPKCPICTSLISTIYVDTLFVHKSLQVRILQLVELIDQRQISL
jgi:filamentous hemagglutinin